MSGDRFAPLTRLLQAAGDGDAAARQQLLDMVYDALRAMAHRQMAKEASGQTLQTTVLVHEAYLRLFGTEAGGFANRREFFAAAGEAMRRICVDDARKRNRVKRGGGRRAESLKAEPAALYRDPVEVLEVHEALDGLEQEAPRRASVVKLRYFAGLSLDETARALDVSPRTVVNEWRAARAWLHRALVDGAARLGPLSERPSDGDG